MFISPRSEARGSKNGHFWIITIYWNGKVDSLSGWMMSKLPIILKNCSNKSCWELNFIQKSQRAHMSISPRSGAKGSKDWYIWNIMFYWNRKVDSRSGWSLPKVHKKIVQVKVVQNCISYKKVRGHTCLSHSGLELEGSKDWYILNIILYWNGKVDSLQS